MKRTKKQVYRDYGIEFEKGKLYCDPLKKWINPLLPVGTNTKVGNAATWSMIHGNELYTLADAGKHVAAVMVNAGITEIKGTCPCHCSGCYCDNGCYKWDNTKASLIEKTIIARLFPVWFEKAVTAQIIADGIKQVRIHAAGDFFSKGYCETWQRVAEKCIDTAFWTYTKNPDALAVFANVKNVSIVPSITPVGINYGTCKELLKKYNELTAAGFRVHICACGTVYEKHCSDCNTGCKAIGTTCDYVLFIKHSTNDYTAGKDDPIEYAAVCEIIRKQGN